jgi:hypothetical protein
MSAGVTPPLWLVLIVGAMAAWAQHGSDSTVRLGLARTLLLPSARRISTSLFF